MDDAAVYPDGSNKNTLALEFKWSANRLSSKLKILLSSLLISASGAPSYTSFLAQRGLTWGFLPGLKYRTRETDNSLAPWRMHCRKWKPRNEEREESSVQKRSDYIQKKGRGGP